MFPFVTDERMKEIDKRRKEEIKRLRESMIPLEEIEFNSGSSFRDAFPSSNEAISYYLQSPEPLYLCNFVVLSPKTIPYAAGVGLVNPLKTAEAELKKYRAQKSWYAGVTEQCEEIIYGAMLELRIENLKKLNE